MPFDPMFMIFMIPGLILAGIATVLTRTTFSKYSQVRASSGLTGAEAARRLLDGEGLQSVRVERVGGFLSDHYDPTSRTLRLSPAVYDSPSLSAVGVACHEAGHALQHAQHYGPLFLRSALVPVAQFGSNFSYILIALGLMLNFFALAKIGVILFGAAVLFSLVTLPVEWDASLRAKRLLVADGIVSPSEQPGAAAVLNAAFLTYVAAAVSSLLTLLYYVLRLGLLGRRND